MLINSSLLILTTTLIIVSIYEIYNKYTFMMNKIQTVTTSMTNDRMKDLVRYLNIQIIQLGHDHIELPGYYGEDFWTSIGKLDNLRFSEKFTILYESGKFDEDGKNLYQLNLIIPQLNYTFNNFVIQNNTPNGELKCIYNNLGFEGLIRILYNPNNDTCTPILQKLHGYDSTDPKFEIIADGISPNDPFIISAILSMKKHFTKKIIKLLTLLIKNDLQNVLKEKNFCYVFKLNI